MFRSFYRSTWCTCTFTCMYMYTVHLHACLHVHLYMYMCVHNCGPCIQCTLPHLPLSPSPTLSPPPPSPLPHSCTVIHFLMEKMPLKWLLVHQLTFVTAFLYVLLDLTNEVSSGTVTLAKEYIDKLLTQVNLYM